MMRRSANFARDGLRYLLVCALFSFAQFAPLMGAPPSTATLRGIASDSSGTVAGLDVQLYLLGTNRGVPRLTLSCHTATQQDGLYRCEHLAPGRYLLVASHLRDQAVPKSLQQPLPAFQFYPEGTDLDRARVIELQDGDSEAADLYLTSTPSYRLSGQITDQPVRPTISLSIRSESGLLYEVPQQAKYSKEGRFEFDDLPAGAYQVRADWAMGQERISSEEQVSVNYDIDNLVLRGMEPSTVTVVSDLEPSSTAASSISLEEVHTGLKSTALPTHGSNHFLYSDQPPGDYVLFADGSGEECISSLSVGGRDATNPIHLTGDQRYIEIDAETTPKCGNVQGEIASHMKGQFVLANDQFQVIRIGDAESGGHISLRGMPAGSYYLFAWARLEGVPFRSVTYLRSQSDRAVRFDISDSEHVDIGMVELIQ